MVPVPEGAAGAQGCADRCAEARGQAPEAEVGKGLEVVLRRYRRIYVREMKMVKYQMEQLARKDAQIAALKRQNKALQREVKRLRMDPLAAHDAALAERRAAAKARAVAERRAAEERLALEVELKETKN